MKLLNFFRQKREPTYTNETADAVKTATIEESKTQEKFPYNSAVTLANVLHYIEKNAAKLFYSLNKPASDEEIAHFEKNMFALPNDIKQLYRFSNGFEDNDMFRFIPLNEIIEKKRDSWLTNETSFHFAEYLIYCDMWSIEIDSENKNNYRIYNKSEQVVYLTNSIAEYLAVFINKGLYEGLVAWQEKIAKAEN